MSKSYEAMKKPFSRSFQEQFYATNSLFMNEPCVSAACHFCGLYDALILWQHTSKTPSAVPISWGFCTSCKERGPFKTIKNGTDYQPTSVMDNFIYNSQIEFSKLFLNKLSVCYDMPKAPDGCKANFLERLLLNGLSGQVDAFAGLVGFARLGDICALNRAVRSKQKTPKKLNKNTPCFIFPFGPSKPGKFSGFYAYTPNGTYKFYESNILDKKIAIKELVFLCTGYSNRMYISDNWAEAVALSEHYANTKTSVVLKLPQDDFQLTLKKPLADIVHLMNIPPTFG